MPGVGWGHGATNDRKENNKIFKKMQRGGGGGTEVGVSLSHQ